jgi:hypothetical protein
LLSRKNIRRKAGQKKRENQPHPRVPFFPRDLSIRAAVFDAISGIAPLLKLGLIAHPLDRVQREFPQARRCDAAGHSRNRLPSQAHDSKDDRERQPWSLPMSNQGENFCRRLMGKR